jgi:hypothetical protein
MDQVRDKLSAEGCGCDIYQPVSLSYDEVFLAKWQQHVASTLTFPMDNQRVYGAAGT